MIVDGKIRHFQHRKFCLDCSPYGAGNNRNLARKTKTCQRCQGDLPLDDFYWKGQTKTRQPYCKPCMLDYNTERRRKIKQQAVDYKGGKCSVCGYNKSLAAMEFHHLDPSKKDLNIAHARVTFEKLRPELDKCILLCCRCHREAHDPYCSSSSS